MQAPDAARGPVPGPTGASDSELCDLVRDGNAWPLETLWRRHHGIVLAWAARKDPAIAEDAVAEAFDAVFQSLLAGAGPRESFRAYLFRTVQTRLGKHWESRRRGAPLEDLPFEGASLDAGEDSLESAEQRAAAAAALQDLPPRWQQIILAVDVEGRSVQEVAGELELTPNSASVLLKRARDGLRKGWVERMHPARNLPEDCATSVGRFTDLRWGKKNTRRRAEAQAHLDDCADCRRRWVLFGEQAGAIGLSLAGVLALTHEWRRRTATGTLAALSAAGLVLATAGTIGGLALPGSVPAEPHAPASSMSGVDRTAVDVPARAPVPVRDAHRAGRTASGPGTGGASEDGVPESPRSSAPRPTAPGPGPSPAPTPSPTDVPPALYFGDWTGWCERSQTFSADC
ncbi:RNA polymerase sigma factor [Leucobacter sp. HNU]|uniref:RNA polymerase sigma factor n=1 Tax=Leucobacter sp. HNU TaxID=3236805 RepID=UPI003A80F03B